MMPPMTAQASPIARRLHGEQTRPGRSSLVHHASAHGIGGSLSAILTTLPRRSRGVLDPCYLVHDHAFARDARLVVSVAAVVLISPEPRLDHDGKTAALGLHGDRSAGRWRLHESHRV